MTGDPIVSYPNTITGSVGVIYGKVNLRGLYDKLGVNKEILVRGANAAIDSDYTPMTPEARAKLREGIEEIYREFVSRVAEGRKKKWEEVAPLAEGRAWLGSQAKQNGLVDEVGGIDKSIELLRKRAGIKADERLELVPYPPKTEHLRSISEKHHRTGSGNTPSTASRLRLPGVVRRGHDADHALCHRYSLTN